MADLILAPSSSLDIQDRLLSSPDLGDTIRAIEKATGQPSQLIIMVGGKRYLAGDWRTRRGAYILEMNKSYTPKFSTTTIPNPHRELSDTYPSFDSLSQAVESAPNKSSEGPFLKGNPEREYYVGVHGVNHGRAGGQQYIRIGAITIPLLQDGETAFIKKLK